MLGVADDQPFSFAGVHDKLNDLDTRRGCHEGTCPLRIRTLANSALPFPEIEYCFHTFSADHNLAQRSIVITTGELGAFVAINRCRQELSIRGKLRVKCLAAGGKLRLRLAPAIEQ